MLPSMAASRSGHWNQEGSRKWQRTIFPTSETAHPGQDIAAETFDDRHALAAARRDRPLQRTPPGMASRICSIRGKALLDFADADPDAGVDVARTEYGNGKIEPIVGRVTGSFPCIEIASAGTADISGRSKLPGEFGANDSSRDGAVLQ